jgi:hypothetical protein
MRYIAAAAANLGALAYAAPGAAQAPVALVEDVQGAPPGVEFMDYVAAGTVIRVGTEQSIVEQGKVERGKVPCDVWG